MPSRDERRISVLLFGNRHKLDLLAALAEAGDGGVSVSTLADRHGVAASVYYAPLTDLMEAGLVVRLDPVPRDRRRWYVRVEHRAWRSLRSLAQDLAELEARGA